MKDSVHFIHIKNTWYFLSVIQLLQPVRLNLPGSKTKYIPYLQKLLHRTCSHVKVTG